MKDYLQTFYTYHALHLLIVLFREDSGLWSVSLLESDCDNMSEHYHLEEGEVEPRNQYVNQRKDHYHTNSRLFQQYLYRT